MSAAGVRTATVPGLAVWGMRTMAVPDHAQARGRSCPVRPGIREKKRAAHPGQPNAGDSFEAGESELMADAEGQAACGLVGHA